MDVAVADRIRSRIEQCRRENRRLVWGLVPLGIILVALFVLLTVPDEVRGVHVLGPISVAMIWIHFALEYRLNERRIEDLALILEWAQG